MNGRDGKIRTAVITGVHPYDVPNFHAFLRGMESCDCYVQSLEDYVWDWGKCRTWYDVVLFYNMHQESPTGEVQAVLEKLGGTEQGLVVLHHAILAFPQWPMWSDVVGISDRSFGFHYEQTVETRIAAENHPILRDLTDWSMVDETYTMADADDDSSILLTVEHPKSMRAIGWTRQFKKARVFCYESGHDHTAWSEPNFQTVVERGIQWAAQRLD